MPRTESPEIEELLAKWGAGDREAPATVKRHWPTARIWLYQQLNGDARA
jgi:hypothetical protein